VVAGATVLVCLIAVWWRSRTHGVELRFTRSAIQVEHGRITVELDNTRSTGLSVAKVRRRGSLFPLLLPQYARDEDGRPMLVIPIVFVFTIVMLTTLLIWRPWTAARGRKGHCAGCGYDLTGNVSGICPECGLARNRPKLPPPARIAQRVRSGRFWWTASAAGLFMVVLFISLRTIDRRLVCAANLRDIERGLCLYGAPDQGDWFPPADVDWKRELVIGNMIDRDSLVCPGCGSDESYVYIPGYNIAATDPRQIIMFDRPSNHLIGGHVLYVDSSVEWFFEPEYSRIISTVTRPDGTRVWPPSR